MAAAAQETAEKVKLAVRVQTRLEVEWNRRDMHVVKGNQYPNDVWVLGPAQIAPMASAYHKLVKLGYNEGADVRQSPRSGWAE